MQAKKHEEPKKKPSNEAIRKSASRINEHLPRKTPVRGDDTNITSCKICHILTEGAAEFQGNSCNKQADNIHCLFHPHMLGRCYLATRRFLLGEQPSGKGKNMVVQKEKR